MRRRLLIIATFAVALVAAIASGGRWEIKHLANAVVEYRYGPTHRFPLKAAGSTFLTDSRALSLAREVMSADGYLPSEWEPIEDRRTKAPDGSADIYIARNGLEPNGGFITFGSTASMRTVIFEPDGDKLIVRTYLPK